MPNTVSLPPTYFEQMFAGDPDPWDFETSAYEAAKYDASVKALGGRRYMQALDVGCANGVLTQRLAHYCEAILAVDVSETALLRARQRNADQQQITFCEMVFPSQTPDGRFDLIVLSEVAYYWSDDDIAAAGTWIGSHLSPGGDLLLVHWTGVTDYPQSGDHAVTLLRDALPEMSVIRADRHENYRLDLWRMT